jgi:ArsR family transcriptional regulator
VPAHGGGRYSAFLDVTHPQQMCTTGGIDIARWFDNNRTVQDTDRKLARLFSALSNPNRLKIYSEILKSEKTNFEVGSWCSLSQVVQSLKIGSPTISHHVKELVDAGLIIAERQGKYLVCRINPEMREMVRNLFG